MIGREKATELHKRYGQLDYPIDAEDMATREGLTVIVWPFLPPVEEVKVGHCSCFGAPSDAPRESAITFRKKLDGSRSVRQTSSLLIFLCLRRSFKS
ncbi:MAG: hypothetical protein Q7J06_01190 [Bacteroidales bacterium]|nr:hypothetical protein [Bacteroidales bacterium]